KKRVRAIVEPAAGRARGERQAALRELLAAAAETQAPPAPAEAPEAPGPSKAPEAEEVESAILLPASIPQNALVDQLRAGAFEQALDGVNAALQSPGEMSLKLYLKGMAQLGLAEASGDEDRY